MNIQNSKFLYPLFLIAVSIAIGLAAITTQSLWMDEGNAALKALMPTLSGWWTMNLRMGGSDVQMPVYMVCLWGWEKITSDTEFALRAINLPFLVIMVIALRKVRFWPLVCLTSPFVLYYVGELRPYTMQMAAGACAAAALARVIRSRFGEFNGLHGIYGSALFLCACSLTAVVWAGGLILGTMIIRPDWLKTRGFWLRSLIWLPPALGIGGYYAFTIIEGYRATASGGGGLLSLLFGFYEMAGLLGLGPSRNELREGISTLVPHLFWLVPASSCLAIAWFLGLRQWMAHTPRRIIIAISIAFTLPIIILATVGHLADFRVLGRHLSPGIPAVLLPISVSLANTERRLGFLTASISILIALVSATSLRLLRKHARDDYRSATQIALTALKNRKSVLWQADHCTPLYYAYRMGGMPYVKAFEGLLSDPPSGYMFADWVILNRPELHYKGQDHKNTLRRADFSPISSPMGFEVWKSRYSQ